MKQKLVISCPASSRSGYGDHSRDIIKSLISMDKFDIKILDQRWGWCPRTALQDEPELAELVIPLGTPLTEQPDVWIQVTVPNEFKPVGKFNIGITAGIETDRVAPEWLEGMNRMDINIVPSHHSKLVFEQTKYDKKDKQGNAVSKIELEKPIYVLFEGLDINVFDKTPSEKLVSVKGLDEIKESFCFLSVGHWLQGELGHDRKDIGGVIQTFIHTFKNMQTKPALILKTSSATFSVMDRYDMEKRIKSIYSGLGGDIEKMPKVYLLHGDLTPQEMNSLYNHPKVKAMISLTHGEGFGRPLLEFSVTGKPTIATNWSGHVDFLNNYGFRIPGKVDEVHKSVFQEGIIEKGAKWFYADYGYASKLLKDVYRKYKTFLTTSRKQRKYVKDNFTLDLMKDEFSEIIKENVPEPVKLKLPTLKLPKLEKIDE
tara:strand:+ start:25417 stop:26700 length:1284 start_codon:yes stop_codon:yes gene_type:complete